METTVLFRVEGFRESFETVPQYHMLNNFGSIGHQGLNSKP